MIRVLLATRQLTRDEFEQKTLRAAARNAELEARRLATEIGLEIRRDMAATYPRRTGSRHKTGQRHADRLFTTRVERGPDPGGFPFRVVIGLRPGLTDDEKAKAYTLIGGSRAHRIEPRTGEYLFFPHRSKPKLAKVPYVDHPGTTGSDIPRLARNRVVARRRRRG